MKTDIIDVSRDALTSLGEQELSLSREQRSAALRGISGYAESMMDIGFDFLGD